MHVKTSEEVVAASAAAAVVAITAAATDTAPFDVMVADAVVAAVRTAVFEASRLTL